MAKTRIPKRIGGVKVPKKVRKQAKKAIKLVESPVRDFAISGLTAAAEALAARTASELRAAGSTQRKASLAALDLGDMLREAAIEGARRFLAGFEEASKAATATQPARAAPAKRPGAAAKPRAARKARTAAAKPKTSAARKAPAKAKPAASAGAKPAAKRAARKPTGRSARKPTGGAGARG